jgi:hypothetical protein
MAIRRVNFTGRKRIGHDRISLHLAEAGGGIPAVEFQVEFDSEGLPNDALVFLEAYRQTTFMRFDAGLVSEQRQKKAFLLTEFQSADAVLFRLKVTSPENGVLLAEADTLRPAALDEKGIKRSGLLPVRSAKDLGSELFRLDFEDRPTLLINDSLGDWRALATSPLFASLTLPLLLREILNRVLHVEKHFDADPSDSDWKSRWLWFGVLTSSAPPPEQEADSTEIDDWVDDVVAAFSANKSIVNRFKKHWQGGLE